MADPTDWHHRYSEWAFFPGYPVVVRMVRELTRMPYGAAALTVSVLCGLLAVWAMYLLGQAYGGVPVARGTALLFAAWPGTAIFGHPYSEGLFIAAAALSLALLLKERWLLAGLFGALACATRPTGAALLAAGAAVALHRLARDRDPRPLLAPLLSATGVAAFVGYGWARTGDPLVWRHAENLWRQKLDFSQQLIETTAYRLSQPERTLRAPNGWGLLATSSVQVAGAIALLVLLVAVWVNRRRLSLPLAAYGVVVLGMIVMYSAVGPRPRTLMALLPAFVWVAAWWPRRVTIAVAVVLAPMIGLLMYLWLWKVIP